MEVYMPEPRKLGPFSMFSVSDEIQVNRIGKRVTIRGRDNQFTDSDSVEANILFEILKVLKKK